MRDLNTLIENLVSGFTILGVADINASGQIVARISDGSTFRAVLLNPNEAAPAVPVPPAAPLLAMGVLALWGLRRRA